jgi:hypothetical protein
MHKDLVQSLWIGGRLSTMERLSILSYLEQGHPFHLYVYEPVTNIPDGVTVRNGQEILPSEEIFCYQHGYGKGSVAAFANCFRYKLLLDRGGWWSDLDIVCLRPLDFPADHVVGYERRPYQVPHVNNALIKAPVGSLLMRNCFETSWKVDRSTLRWGQIGPTLLRKTIDELSVPVKILEPSAFYPIDYWRAWDLIRSQELPTDGWTIHMWHSQWQDHRLNPDHVYCTGCIYEQLKRKFKVCSPVNAPTGPSWIAQSRHYWLRRQALRQAKRAVRAAA